MTQRELDARVASIQYTETTDLNLPAIEVAGDAFEAGVEWADGHPRWISVEDELPKGEEAICLLDNGERVIMECDMVDKMNRYSTHHYITHWMPLPEPPKKGGEQ